MTNENNHNDIINNSGGDNDNLIVITTTNDKSCIACGISSLDTTVLVEIQENIYLCQDCINTMHGHLLEVVKASGTQAIDEMAELSELIPVDTLEVAPSVTPRDINKYLDNFIVGQYDAKRTLSLAAYNHMKKVSSKMNFKKANVLLVGPTGTGKTALVENLAKIMDVPYIIYDCTQLTVSGYVGEDATDIISALYAASGNDVQKTQRGIVVLDEIDKLRKTAGNRGKDIGGADTQRMLLKTLESSNIQISSKGDRGRSSAGSDIIDINTKDILFISSGAFVDLPDIINKRLSKDCGMGFNAKVNSKADKAVYDEAIEQLLPEDLIEYGMIPEFIGRFSVITHTKSLTLDLMKKIITEPEDSELSQIKQLLEMDDVILTVDESALNEIAARALKHNTGARAIRNILYKELGDLMFDAPEYTVKQYVTLSYLLDGFILTFKNSDITTEETIASEAAEYIGEEEVDEI